jgi:hypothetical protein
MLEPKIPIDIFGVFSDNYWNPLITIQSTSQIEIIDKLTSLGLVANAVKWGTLYRAIALRCLILAVINVLLQVFLN